jgi:hypothetical protein
VKLLESSNYIYGGDVTCHDIQSSVPKSYRRRLWFNNDASRFPSPANHPNRSSAPFGKQSDISSTCTLSDNQSSKSLPSGNHGNTISPSDYHGHLLSPTGNYRNIAPPSVNPGSRTSLSGNHGNIPSLCGNHGNITSSDFHRNLISPPDNHRHRASPSGNHENKTSLSGSFEEQSFCFDNQENNSLLSDRSLLSGSSEHVTSPHAYHEKKISPSGNHMHLSTSCGNYVSRKTASANHRNRTSLSGSYENMSSVFDNDVSTVSSSAYSRHESGPFLSDNLTCLPPRLQMPEELSEEQCQSHTAKPRTGAIEIHKELPQASMSNNLTLISTRNMSQTAKLRWLEDDDDNDDDWNTNHYPDNRHNMGTEDTLKYDVFTKCNTDDVIVKWERNHSDDCCKAKLVVFNLLSASLNILFALLRSNLLCDIYC